MEYKQLYTEVCEAINAFIKRNDLTEKEVKKRLCLSDEQYKALKEKRLEIDGAKLFEMSHALGVLVVDIFEYEDQEKDPDFYIKRGSIILFTEGSDYLINDIEGIDILCHKIDIMNDCRVVNNKTYVFTLDFLEYCNKKEKCVIF